MDFAKLTRNELVAAFGGLLLAIGVFIKWYETRPQNANAQINGMGCAHPAPGSGIEAGDCTYSGWQVHDILRWLLILGAVAPFILAYIIARDHKLSWARGEMTAVVAVIAFGLIFYNGIIDRPGEPSGEIELEIGWYVALLGSILMFAGAALRSSESERKRKPPGTI
jgi:hypothetical protein